MVSREELLKKLEERYRRGEISYETYISLKSKYAGEGKPPIKPSKRAINIKYVAIAGFIVLIGLGIYFIGLQKVNVRNRQGTPPPTSPGPLKDWGLTSSMHITLTEAKKNCSDCYIVTAISDIYLVKKIGLEGWGWAFRFYCPSKDKIFVYWCRNMKPEFENLIGMISAANLNYSEIKWGIKPGEAYSKALASGGESFIQEYGEDNVYVQIIYTTRELARYYGDIQRETTNKFIEKDICLVKFSYVENSNIHQYIIILDSNTGNLLAEERKG